MTVSKEARLQCIELRKQRMSFQKIHEETGISITTLHDIFKPLGLCGAIADNAVKNPKNQYTSGKYNQLSEAIDKYVKGKPWEYVSGFVNIDSHARFRCTICGEESDISFISFRQDGRKNVPRCLNCIRIKKRKIQQEIKSKKKVEKLKKEVLHYKQMSFSFCECGRLKNEHAKLCQYCRKRMNNSNHEHKRRLKIRKQMIDNDITLERLAKKETNICWVCKQVVDWNDKQNVNGTIICGNRYPSIDHVVALSQGGLHSWENVRLAHRICNSKRWTNEQKYAPWVS